MGRVMLGQRGHLFAWLPVGIAFGIGLYFALRVEPPVWLLVVSAGAAMMGAAGAWRLGPSWGPWLALPALMAMGLALAGGRAHLVAGPVLTGRYYGPVEGRIVGIDRSASDAVRLTLDRVRLERGSVQPTPVRVRVSLHGTQGFTTLAPGRVVMMTAHLSAPRGAAEPGGFDFRRHAWFQRLGAVGYTRTPVLTLEPGQGGVWFFRLRQAMADRIRAVLPGDTGGFAAAILTGDRSAIGQAVLDDLRRTNLAHLLAISGLHMGLLTGVVFATLRLTMLLIPGVGLRWPVKKLAAAGALVAAGFYLGLSGGNVATERAFVMVAVMLVAVMLNRRAISLRAVALAALIVLIWQPEALLGPGFQMSFAATTALVAVFGCLRDRNVPRSLRPVLALVVSSAVAGAATAPVGMAHFNQVAHFGLLANLVSVPLMGALVIPAGVFAVVLMPLGLEAWALRLMGLGLDWILLVARSVADWPLAVTYVPRPPDAVLPLMAAGGLFVMLWQGRWRWLGMAPVMLSVALWLTATRPDLLIAENGTLVGVMTPAGRALSRETGEGFVASVWMENDGDGANQQAAAARWVNSPQLRHLRGKRAASDFSGCSRLDIVVSDRDLPADAPCILFQPSTLRGQGSVAGYRTKKGYVFVTDLQKTGHRLWHPGTPFAQERRADAQ
ncbi:ComEC/Rec2 family competence protein [Mesobacterium sp. TK19101]|uniref:ComEC/Rec2 family competence protein n=1 Tax=Mesobacterium hydrothermale TaxID=3111907 RepID=A0ABU6HG59_9RHOB|nr:ComEC/Rec2 family competence protein [Mesobacterium sp. TK19101]MEC3860453.1 ComEC/Rec2 family competence protein [Mesobacterium sp. TK19101]